MSRSYLLPVANHFRLYFGWARGQRAEGLHRWPTHPYWQRNGSEKDNVRFTPKMDGVAPLQMEVRVRCGIAYSYSHIVIREIRVKSDQ